jgi:hypothetical protein
MTSAVKASLMFNIKTTAMACTQPRTEDEYMMCELELAVCKTIRRCLWAAASLAQERGSHEQVVEEIFKAVNRFVGLSHLRCSKEDHDHECIAILTEVSCCRKMLQADSAQEVECPSDDP